MHISERLKEAATEWGVAQDKVVAVVHDNAANMVLAGELLEGWGDLSCFGHTLLLAVNAGLALNAIARLNSGFPQDCWSFQAQHCSHGCPDREAEVAKNSRAQPCPGCCYKVEFHLLYVRVAGRAESGHLYSNPR